MVRQIKHTRGVWSDFILILNLHLPSLAKSGIFILMFIVKLAVLEFTATLVDNLIY